jgi:hypothetical protein
MTFGEWFDAIFVHPHDPVSVAIALVLILFIGYIIGFLLVVTVEAIDARRERRLR